VGSDTDYDIAFREGLAEVVTVQSQPYAPIYSIERSDHQEVLIEGIVSVVAGTASGSVRNLLTIGDDRFLIWTRSILKPWQTTANLPFLQEGYPDLLPQHLAVITGSHRAGIEHLCLLRQIISLGRVSEDDLRCPVSMPKDQQIRLQFERESEGPRRLFHNCSGKHLGYLLAMKAQKIKTDNYLDPTGPQHRPLLSVLHQLTGRPIESFLPTVDGCQLPNYSLTAFEAATLYLGLLNHACLPTARIDDAGLVDRLSYVGGLMRSYPDLIDGQGTLDTDIMKGRFLKVGDQTKLVAKVGAEGLLAVGVGPTEIYPYGAGILIKLAHGMTVNHIEIIVKELMRQMSLTGDTVDGAKKDSHLRTKFYFKLAD
jgi:L-asparaginase II